MTHKTYTFSQINYRWYQSRADLIIVVLLNYWILRDSANKKFVQFHIDLAFHYFAPHSMKICFISFLFEVEEF
jgi:hypothetical protein